MSREGLLEQFQTWNAFVLDIKDIDWKIPLQEGKWTIHDVVCHIMLWDQYFYERMIQPIASDHPITVEHIDFDAFNAQAVAYGKDKTKDELIVLTVQSRNAILNCIRELDETVYANTYAEGQFTFESYLKDFIWHDQHHMKQIQTRINQGV